MSEPINAGILYPIGPTVPVDNVINCNEGKIGVGGYVHGLNAGEKGHVIAKVYSGTPYTYETMPEAPPQNLVEDVKECTGLGVTRLASWSLDIEGVLCGYGGKYPDVQLLVWASREADTPESHVYTRQVRNLKGVAIRPTEPMRYPMMMPGR